ncbi:MAG: hypothetical protein ABDH91_08680 [Bacteroidia bacterium]
MGAMARANPLPSLRRVAFTTVCGLVLSGCASDPTSSEAALPEISFSVWRAEVALRYGYSRPEDSLRQWAFLYDCIYGGDTTQADSAYQSYVKYSTDWHIRWLTDTVLRRYPKTYDFAAALKPLFQRWKYFFPTDTLPQVVTFVTGYDPNPILALEYEVCHLCEKHLMIGLNYFLSDTFPYYQPDLPYYIRRRLTEPHLPVFVALELIQSKMPPKPQPCMGKEVFVPTLVHHMIWHGIRLYALEQLLPELHDTLRLFYTQAHLDWLAENARYAYKELLPYFQETKVSLLQPFVEEEPFTKLFGRDSPPRLGWYFGWQIVRRYVARKKVSLPELLQLEWKDYPRVLAEAQYRP